MHMLRINSGLTGKEEDEHEHCPDFLFISKQGFSQNGL